MLNRYENQNYILSIDKLDTYGKYKINIVDKVRLLEVDLIAWGDVLQWLHHNFKF